MPSFGKILRAVLREKWWLTDGPTIRSLTSTDVENCNVLTDWSQLLDLPNFSTFSNPKNNKEMAKPKWIIQRFILVVFGWSSMTSKMANLCAPSTSIKLYNIKSMWCTKFEKMAKNVISSYLDRSKVDFSDFWMIEHELYDGQIVHTIYFYRYV